jgi:hypothetical protein
LRTQESFFVRATSFEGFASSQKLMADSENTVRGKKMSTTEVEAGGESDTSDQNASFEQE